MKCFQYSRTVHDFSLELLRNDVGSFCRLGKSWGGQRSVTFTHLHRESLHQTQLRNDKEVSVLLEQKNLAKAMTVMKREISAAKCIYKNIKIISEIHGHLLQRDVLLCPYSIAEHLHLVMFGKCPGASCSPHHYILWKSYLAYTKFQVLF